MHNHANIRIIFEETMGPSSPGTSLLGKQNIQAKEVYCSCDIVFFFFVLRTVQYFLLQVYVAHQLD